MTRSTTTEGRGRSRAHTGLMVLALVFVAGALAACIFDQGDYKGGGRIPVLTASASGSGTDTETPPAPPPPPGGLDAGTD